MHRWLIDLKEYDFVICHHAGKLQGHVDGVLQLPCHPKSIVIIEATPYVMEQLEQVTHNVHNVKHPTPGLHIISIYIFDHEG